MRGERVRTKRFKAALLSILVVASLLAPMLALIGTSEAEVYPDVDNIILRGSEYAYGTEDTDRDDAPPLIKYVEGDFPPIIMADRIGSGAVVAAGFGATSRNNEWNRTGNPDPHWDDLLDIMFQWMVPGALNVLWYEGHNVYNTTSQCSHLIAALGTLGYFIADSTQPITSSLLDPYDILVIPQMQGGAAGTGGEPVLSDAELDAIRNFVEGGKGLLIIDSSDWYGHNYYRAQNQVLENLRFSEYEDSYFGFQSDMIYDDINNVGGDIYRPILDVDNSTEIGAAYQSRLGKTTIGVYSPCSMVKIGPGVIITGIPKYRVGMPSDTLEYEFKITNTSVTGDDLTINLQVSDTAGWNPWLDRYSLGVVENSKYEYVKLSVTIPASANVGDEDTITVTVTTEEFATLTANFTVTAHTAVWIVADEDTFASTQDPDTPMDGEHPDFIAIGRYQINWSYGYFKWDASLSQIPPDATIVDAKIVLSNWYAYGSPYPAVACELGDDWSEETLTWNNKPENGPIIYTTTMVKGTEDDPEPYFWDVTSYLDAQLKGDGVASFSVRPLDNQPENSVRRVESKDIDFSPYWVFEGVHPFLQVHYTVDRDVDVSISPDSRYGLPKGTLTYEVKITNRGELADTYDLVVTDAEGWNPTLSNNTLTIPGDWTSQTVTLSVTIPAGAAPDTFDNIIVTVTSQADSSVSDDDTCAAYAGNKIAPPTDDAPVREESPGSNYGTERRPWVQNYLEDTTPKNGRIFFKFDLSQGIPPIARITSAKLYLYHYRAAFADMNVQVRKVNDDSWDEGTITWGTQPSYGDVLDSLYLYEGDNGEWRSWDITSFVAGEFAGDKIASFCLKAEVESLPEGESGSHGFYSKEHSYFDKRPYLEVEVEPAPVDVSISPDEDSAAPGEDVSFTVTVKNETGVTDTYDLSASGTEVWSLSLSSDTIGPLDNGEDGSVTLTVSIPGTAEMGTEDTVTVTATSQADPTLQVLDTCIARAGGLEEAGVSVSISPSEDSGEPGTTLTYTVTIVNEGDAEDTYDLTVTDALAWGATVSPTPLTIATGDSDTATVRVTIPDGTAGGTEDEITVEATSRTDSTVSDSAICTAQATAAPPPDGEGLPITLIAIVVVVVVVVVVVALMFLRGRKAAPSWGV